MCGQYHQKPGMSLYYATLNRFCLDPGCDPNNFRAFIWSRFGTFYLGTLPGQTSSYASGINSRLQVVGESGYPDQIAFFWQPGLGMIDLNKLIHAPGWVLENALSINDRAEIVGYGTLDAFRMAFCSR
jgi:probable HAF family extracellular repeat protein